MLILLSPAKSLDFETPAPTKTTGIPRFLDGQTTELAKALKKLKPADLSDLMEISARLAELNHQRNQAFDAALIHQQAAGPAPKKSDPPPPAKQALWAFTGDVYQGLDAASLKGAQIRAAQARIRMLSGLYGVLTPCDLMLPYRLEMGTRLTTKKGKNLYEFWGSAITESLAAEKPDWICNLASKEYYTSVKEKELPCPVVHPVFQDEVKGTYRVMGMFAKYARGLMARWIIDEGVKKADDLAGFDRGGYAFSEAASTPEKPVFLRPESAR
jgi:cytoplasmic iron level regulating protein YaaA (DUF328/UPF0246 family)